MNLIHSIMKDPKQNPTTNNHDNTIKAAFDAETIAAAVSKADELKAATELFLGK